MSEPGPLSAVKFKSVRLLLNKKYRLKEGRCLIEGRRFVSEALRAGATVEMVMVTVDFAAQNEGKDLIGVARLAGAEIRTINPSQLPVLSDTVTAQGVVAVVRLPGAALEDLPVRGPGPSLVIALDGVSDPGNVGTIIRTGAWFGADGILLGAGCAELSSPKVLRSTMGAVFHVPVVAGADLPDAVRRLKRDGFRIIAAAAGGVDTFAGATKSLMIFGSEAHGVSAELVSMADARYWIPKYGAGESLNVSVAAGVALSRFRAGQG